MFFDIWHKFLKKEFYKNLSQFNIYNSDKKIDIMLCPPPNLTGEVHIGHLMEFVLMDYMSRSSFIFNKEQKIFNFFGVDHAGGYSEILAKNYLSNNNILDNKLNILKRIILNSKSNYLSIINTIKSFGFMCIDYASYTYSASAKNIVKKAYNDLVADGLVYKQKVTVPWECTLQSYVSQLEIVYKYIKNKLFFIKYFAVGRNDLFLTVATTRPETMFSDTVLIAHNSMKKQIYSKFGKNPSFVIPYTKRKICIFFCGNINSEFGTGLMKLTPTHSLYDYNLAKKYNLPIGRNTINICGKFVNCILSGMTINEGREYLINLLTRDNFIVNFKYIHSRIPFNSRTCNRIEYIYIYQLFIDLPKLAISAKKYIYASNISNNYKVYLNNIYNNIDKWCVSRGGFYGHKVPSVIKLKNRHIFDTWFSASLWPIIVFSSNRINIKNINFSIMAGKDILLFWIFKMICMLKFLNLPNFNKIVLHGLICDKSGNKISKSKGNVIDSSHFVKCKNYNDAFRVSVLMTKFTVESITIHDSKVLYGVRFVNKIKNINIIFKKIFLQKRKLKIVTTIKNPLLIWEYNILKNTYIKLKNINLEELYLLFDDIDDLLFKKISPILVNFIKSNVFIIKYKEKCELITIYLKYIKILHAFVPNITEEIFLDLKLNIVKYCYCNTILDVDSLQCNFDYNIVLYVDILLYIFLFISNNSFDKDSFLIILSNNMIKFFKFINCVYCKNILNILIDKKYTYINICGNRIGVAVNNKVINNKKKVYIDIFLKEINKLHLELKICDSKNKYSQNNICGNFIKKYLSLSFVIKYKIRLISKILFILKYS